MTDERGYATQDIVADAYGVPLHTVLPKLWLQLVGLEEYESDAALLADVPHEARPAAKFTAGFIGALRFLRRVTREVAPTTLFDPKSVRVQVENNNRKPTANTRLRITIRHDHGMYTHYIVVQFNGKNAGFWQTSDVGLWSEPQ